MRFQSNSRSLMLVASGLLLCGGLWLFVRDSGNGSATGSGLADVSVDAQPLPQAERSESGELLVDGPVEVEPVTLDSSISNKPTSPSTQASSKAALPEIRDPEQAAFRDEFEQQLDDALAGDDFQAIALGKHINSCMTSYRKKEVIERSIERATRRWSSNQNDPLKLPGRTGQTFNSLEAYEQHQWETFDRCEASRDLINEDFWERLIREADAGNPVARYLYASLPRSSSSHGFNFELWDEELAHNERADEYTWRNMKDREPLGILAMAQRLPTTRGPSYSRFSTGAVLTTAAIKCGLITDEMNEKMNQLLEHLQRQQDTYPDALEQLNNASDEVKRMFCK